MLESDDILFDTPNLSPEARLWLACLRDAVRALREKRFGNNTPAKAYARDFLFADHPFFEMLCDSLGYDPEAMRRRVKQAMGLSGLDGDTG